MINQFLGYKGEEKVLPSFIIVDPSCHGHVMVTVKHVPNHPAPSPGDVGGGAVLRDRAPVTVQSGHELHLTKWHFSFALIWI